jgi:hypothetical protein
MFSHRVRVEIVLGQLATIAVSVAPPVLVRAQATAAMPALMASLVCRTARSGETATATTSGNTSLVCKPLSMQPIMAMKPAVMAMPDGELNWRALLKDFTVQSPR